MRTQTWVLDLFLNWSKSWGVLEKRNYVQKLTDFFFLWPRRRRMNYMSCVLSQHSPQNQKRRFRTNLWPLPFLQILFTAERNTFFSPKIVIKYISTILCTDAFSPELKWQFWEEGEKYRVRILAKQSRTATPKQNGTLWVMRIA